MFPRASSVALLLLGLSLVYRLATADELKQPSRNAATKSEESAATTAADYLKRVPAITPNDAKLKTFECEGIFPVAGGGPARFQFAWSRTDGYYFCIHDSEGVPSLVAVPEGVWLFDVAGGVVEIYEAYRPKISLVLEEGKTVIAGFGLTNKSQPEFTIDLPSLVADVKFTKRPSKKIVATECFSGLSPSGNSRYTLDFVSERHMPLERFEVRLLTDEEKKIGIVDENSQAWLILVNRLRVNEPLRRKLGQLPADTAYPEGLPVQRFPLDPKWAKNPAEKAKTGMHDVMHIMMRATVFEAIDSPDLRAAVELALKPDWKAAAERRAKYGPALKKLFAESLKTR